ncbi:hypothetical protein GCM10022247_34900 [Allokutzneria multivorans]|uniref:TnpV protein n=1 Tax=Allokutzneria multivorans TaxID=1142134 RepID=A0ABP7SCE0_9PSEU
MPINHYGLLAQRHWSRYRAQELAEIPDPEEFFTELGEQIQQEILRREDELEPIGTGHHLTDYAELETISQQVRDQVLRDMVFVEAE